MPVYLDLLKFSMSKLLGLMWFMGEASSGLKLGGYWYMLVLTVLPGTRDGLGT